MAAVVHHGGAGTTAEGFYAGVPSVICPFFGDQPGWARIATALGVGPEPIPPRPAHRRPPRPGDHVKRPPIRRLSEKARNLAARLRAEDGVQTAIRLLHGGRQ